MVSQESDGASSGRKWPQVAKNKLLLKLASTNQGMSGISRRETELNIQPRIRDDKLWSFKFITIQLGFHLN